MAHDMTPSARKRATKATKAAGRRTRARARTREELMDDERKAKMELGRKQAGIVQRYLDSRKQAKSNGDGKRKNKHSREWLEAKIASLRAELEAEVVSIKRLELRTALHEYEAELKELDAPPEVDTLEADFVAVAAEYGERKGIVWAAWIQEGVPAKVLEAAGVPRTRRSSN